MNFLIAPNAFKESLDARSVAQALDKGIRRALPRATTDLLPLSDGGPGLLDALHAALGGVLKSEELPEGPLPGMGPLPVQWLQLADGRAVIESSLAIGMELIPARKRRPLAASSLPLGRLLHRILQSRPRRILVGLGGSSTTDGGAGMARALGWMFMNDNGNYLPHGGGALRDLDYISRPLQDLFKGVTVEALCDVDNPLTGPRGSARVFAPQKGASPAEVLMLEEGLKKLEKLVLGKAAARPGAGAAGGLGAGLMVFCGARLVPGARTLLDWTGFDKRLKKADWVISGEGRLDSQSKAGKLPYEICQRAKKSSVPCLLLAGQVEGSPRSWNSRGATEVRSLLKPGMSAAHAMRHAAKLIEQEAFLFAKSL